MTEQDNPFKLAPEKNQQVFESIIKPDLAVKTKAVEQPIFVLIGGQPGAGKSRVTTGVKTA